jgi:hypothetical protein
MGHKAAYGTGTWSPRGVALAARVACRSLVSVSMNWPTSFRPFHDRLGPLAGLMAWLQVRGVGEPERPEGRSGGDLGGRQYDADVVSALVQEGDSCGGEPVRTVDQNRHPPGPRLPGASRELVRAVPGYGAE